MTVSEFQRYCRAFLVSRISLAQMHRYIQEAKPEHGTTALWKAAHEAIKNGKHSGPCDNDADPWNQACSIHIRHFHERRERLAKELGQRWDRVRGLLPLM